MVLTKREIINSIIKLADDIYLETCTLGDDFGLPTVADKAEQIRLFAKQLRLVK